MAILRDKVRRRSPMPVALITGATRGLGRQLAITLSALGYCVAANYVSSDMQADTLMKKLGGDSIALKADVGDIGSVQAMSDTIRKNFGQINVIINNAGITGDNLMIRQTETGWDRILRTNLKGCFNIIRTLSPLMIQSGGGHIINISSRSGLKGKAGQAAYSASKAALLGLTLSAAGELSDYNIRVNAVLPGYMMTEMGAAANKASQRARQESLLRSLSQPEEVADCIASLLKTKNITGQVFNFDSRTL